MRRVAKSSSPGSNTLYGALDDRDSNSRSGGPRWRGDGVTDFRFC